MNYYRIKGISINGEEKYSSIVKVNINKSKGGITVYPNPLVGKSFSLQLSNKQQGTYSLRITNSGGQIIFSTSINHTGGSATQTVQLNSALQKGTYQLELTAEDGTKETTKIINH
jgi:hypothetical protein